MRRHHSRCRPGPSIGPTRASIALPVLLSIPIKGLPMAFNAPLAPGEVGPGSTGTLGRQPAGTALDPVSDRRSVGHKHCVAINCLQ